MLKVKVIEIYQPNIFLGTDINQFDKIHNECKQINHSILSPCSEIILQMVYLSHRNNVWFRLRVVSSVNDYTFKCLLIDDGSIEEIRKEKLYLLPPNKLRMDPAVKLYKLNGIVPAGMNIFTEGDNIKAIIGESKDWIRASYKFVCRLFSVNSLVHVSYVKECSKDKAIVDVFVTYQNQRLNLKDLLISEQYGFAKNDDEISSNPGNLSTSQADDEDNNFIDDFSEMVTLKDEEPETITVPFNDTFTKTFNNDNDLELSNVRLNNKVQSWLVSKHININSDHSKIINYEYKNPIRPILSYQTDPMLASFLKDAMIYHKTKTLLHIQSLMIPAILRGINVMAISPKRTGKSMGLLMPILQKIATKSKSDTRSYSPLVVILCRSWSKVQELTESANLFLNFITETNDTRKPNIVSANTSDLEKKIMVPILKGCDILIVTAECLLRLLTKNDFFKLNELEVMALDDDLICEQFDLCKEIFRYRDIGIEASGNNVQNIVTSARWSPELESVLKNDLGNMFLLTVNNPLEIAIFGGLKQKVIEYQRDVFNLYEILQTYLTMTQSAINRTIIFSSSDNETRSIYRFLQQKVTIDFKLMVGSMNITELKETEREWNQNRSFVNLPVLLISDEALSKCDIAIYNAQTIMHSDINPPMFGSRLNFLRDKVSKLSFLTGSSGKATECSTNSYHSYIFLNSSTLDNCHKNFVVDLLIRSKSDIPRSLMF